MTARQEMSAQQTLDAIRLAVEGASDDKRAVSVIRVLLADAPSPDLKSTEPLRRLIRAFKRVRRAEHWLRP